MKGTPQTVLPILCLLSLAVAGCNVQGDRVPLKDDPYGFMKQHHIRHIEDPKVMRRLAQRSRVLTSQERARTAIVQDLEFICPPDQLFPFPRGPQELLPWEIEFLLCLFPVPTPAAAIDPHRSLFVHDRTTLDAGDFSLRHTLDQIASQVSGTVPGTTRVSIFKQFWDTQNPWEHSLLPPSPTVTSGRHCTDDGQTLNGFATFCRFEGFEARGSDAEIDNRIDAYRPLALVNRLDLAHQGWRNCGEHRIIYGKVPTSEQNPAGGLPSLGGKNLIIFEAVLPNPKPGCREGCLAVAGFWKLLSAIDDPATRALKLEEFFYSGLPGFRPVVHFDHYSAQGVTSVYGGSGTGQIRTNQFLREPWTLKEFKTAIDCGGGPCKFEIVPTMVKVNPHGRLWNEDLANMPGPLQARAQAFQDDVLLQLDTLDADDIMEISYSVDLEHDAAHSISMLFAGEPVPFDGSIDVYSNQFQNAMGPVNDFRTTMGGGSLTATQLVNRANMQSCAGCHEPLNSTKQIGIVTTPTGGVTGTWPETPHFVHIKTEISSPVELAVPAVFGAGQGHELSEALLEVFLPARKSFLLDQLNAPICGCRNRFLFLKNAARTRAQLIDEQIVKRFLPQMQALDSKRRALAHQPPSLAELLKLEREGIALLGEREAQLRAELKRGGIDLPEVDPRDLKPQTMRLEAAKLARGDAARERVLRGEEINQILEQEPPRRTVTGSFRVH